MPVEEEGSRGAAAMVVKEQVACWPLGSFVEGFPARPSLDNSAVADALAMLVSSRGCSPMPGCCGLAGPCCGTEMCSVFYCR